MYCPLLCLLCIRSVCVCTTKLYYIEFPSNQNARILFKTQRSFSVPTAKERKPLGDSDTDTKVIFNRSFFHSSILY